MVVTVVLFKKVVVLAQIESHAFSTGTYNLTFTRNAALNVFLVGEAEAGGAKNSWCAGGGGGGGYTKQSIIQ
jgi:hypothetical protein